MSSSSTSPRVVKTVVLGDSGVGKSSLVMRFVTGTFKANSEPTIGAAFLAKNVVVEGNSVSFQIWDTAGQERYHNITPALYYRGALAALLVFDIVDKRSFERVEFWRNELLAHCCENIAIIVVGNKLDLKDQRVISSESAQNYATSVGALYVEASAKENVAVIDIFSQLYKVLPPPSDKESKTITLHDTREKSKIRTKACC